MNCWKPVRAEATIPASNEQATRKTASDSAISSQASQDEKKVQRLSRMRVGAKRLRSAGALGLTSILRKGRKGFSTFPEYEMWSRRHENCVQCKTTDFKHMAKGLCSSCYARQYKLDPKRRAKVYQQRTEWYWRYRTENLQKRKAWREQKHYAGKREAALKRDGYACTICGSKLQLTVHHRDRNGRGRRSPNNKLSNLVTTCRSCHAKEHSDELQAARRATGYKRKI